jgi:hypothetical protein
MKCSVILDSAKLILGTSRWTDADLLGYFNAGLRYLYASRPECRLAADGSLSALATVTAWTADLPLPDLYAEPLADFVRHMAFAKDAGDTRDAGRAAEWWKRFLSHFEPAAGGR